MMYRKMTASFKTDPAAFAKRQAILRQLEELLKRRAARDGSQVWRCPPCRQVTRSDQGRLPRRGETVCIHCHRDMQLV